MIATLSLTGKPLPSGAIPLLGALSLAALVSSAIAGYRGWQRSRQMPAYALLIGVTVVVVIASGPHPEHERPDLITYLLTVEIIAWLIALASRSFAARRDRPPALS